MTDIIRDQMADARDQISDIRHLSSDQQRAAVLAEARKWIGTPYHNCADVRGAGVDCGMLIVRVFVDAGLCAPFDPRPYPADWHLHRSEERYLGFVFDRCAEVTTPQPGDVMVLRFGRCYSHGGIVSTVEPLTIVHAYIKARRVLEEDVGRNSILADPARKPRFFSYWAHSIRPREAGEGDRAERGGGGAPTGELRSPPPPQAGEDEIGAASASQ